MPEPSVAAARRLAEQLLLPDAAAVDVADRVPDAHLAALDEAGLTGLAASGAGRDERMAVTRELAGGCLATAFVWLQHQGALASIAASDLAARYAAPLADGRLRAGVAITALRPPEPLRIRATAEGWALTGGVPWATGWGIVDVLRVAALDGDVVRSVLIDAVDGPALAADRLDLTAARASRTHALTFNGHEVPADRLVGTVPLADWWAADAAGLAPNGALAIGVAARAAALSGSAELQRAVEAAWQQLLAAAHPDAVSEARAACSAVAVQAAAALTVRSGAGSVLRGGHAERLMREAQFLLVFGSRRPISGALAQRFGAPYPTA